MPWLMQRYGAKDPCYAPTTLADRVTGLHAVYAVTGALFAREKSGEGQAVVVPMFEAMAQFVLGDHMAGLSFDPPAGDAGYARLLTSHRRPYKTKDGYLCVLIYNDKHWRNFFEAIGEADRFMLDPRFSSHGNRAANIDDVYAEVGRIMLERTVSEWEVLLDAADIPNMPMNSPQDLLNDVHLQTVGMIRDTVHPTEGKLHTIGNPTSWSNTPLDAAAEPAPHLGQHSVEVLFEAGYSAAEIERLMADRVTASSTPVQI